MVAIHFLLERLNSDKNLRRICGWESRSQIPSESTFSRAFGEFANTALPERVHESFIKKTLGNEIISHNSRDSTAIEAREKAKEKNPTTHKVNGKPKKKGRPKKGEEKVVPEPKRIEKQLTMTFDLRQLNLRFSDN